jgi:hypothetical protein
MAKKVYIVQRYPMSHPEQGLIPIGEEVDLSHLSDAEIQFKLNRRQIRVKGTRAKTAAKNKTEE